MKKLLVVLIALIMISPVFADGQPGRTSSASVVYSVHMAEKGWGEYASDGATAGTTGEKRRIEAMRARVISDIPGGIQYDTHVSTVGWTGWQFDNDIGGTTGKSLQVEAIRVKLNGQLANRFSVRYRVHMSEVGWSGWALDGEDAGTTGQKRQIEAIEIRLDPK